MKAEGATTVASFREVTTHAEDTDACLRCFQCLDFGLGIQRNTIRSERRHGQQQVLAR
jgi:hypothetical protein